MKRITLLIMIMAILVLVTSCFEDGTLRVRNRTNSRAWFSVDHNPYIYLESFNNWSRDYSSDRNVRIDYNGNHLFSGNIQVSVNLGRITNFDIVADGGAIRINNQTNLTITQVYISPITSPLWGDNQLTGNIGPGGSVLWTVAPGSWDIKVVDSNDDDFFLMNRYVPLDTTVNVNFTYGKEWHSSDCKLAGFDPDFGIKYNIEQK